jgi:hypothetical protein
MAVWWHPAPGVIPGGVFNLDHRRTQITQQHGAVRTGEYSREVGDQQALLGAVIALARRSLSVLRTAVRKRSIDDIENDVKGRNKRSKGKKGNASLCKLFKGRRSLSLPQA